MLIDGGNKISGEIGVQGAKNAVLPILAATVMADGVCTLKNCPYLRDVDKTDLVLERLGCRVQRAGNTVTVDTRDMCDCKYVKINARDAFFNYIFGSDNFKVQKSGCKYARRLSDWFKTD